MAAKKYSSRPEYEYEIEKEIETENESEQEAEREAEQEDASGGADALTAADAACWLAGRAGLLTARLLRENYE